MSMTILQLFFSILFCAIFVVVIKSKQEKKHTKLLFLVVFVLLLLLEKDQEMNSWSGSNTGRQKEMWLLVLCSCSQCSLSLFQLVQLQGHSITNYIHRSLKLILATIILLPFRGMNLSLQISAGLAVQCKLHKLKWRLTSTLSHRLKCKTGQ